MSQIRAPEGGQFAESGRAESDAILNDDTEACIAVGDVQPGDALRHDHEDPGFDGVSHLAITPDGHRFEVQAAVEHGRPGLTVVGRLTDRGDDLEGRIRTLIESRGYTYPGDQRITVLLSPSDLEKPGNYDIHIAAQILRADGQLPPVQDPVERHFVNGDTSR